MTMPSLDQIFCTDPSERKPRNSLHSVCGVRNQRNALPIDRRTKASLRRCNAPNCRKTAKRGGRCIAHGGGNKCAVDGCITSVVSRGLCVAHGGGKRCQTPSCAKSAQAGGFCWVHGGGKKCGYHGCPKRAQSGGACIAHGGGKRCRIGGCNKVVQYDGLCVGHGGYRRCVYMNCNGRAMANDHCQQHGGSSICLLERCYKRAVRGGMCSEHKANASLQGVISGGFPASNLSSDEDQDRQMDRFANYDRLTTKEQSRMQSKDVSRKSRSEHEPSISRLIPIHDKVSGSIALTADRFSHKDEARNRRTDAPFAPGFSALLDANDTCISLSRLRDLEDPKQSDYPILPSIRSLQPFHTGNVETTFHSPTTSDFRLMISHDQTLLKWESNGRVDEQNKANSFRNTHETTLHQLFVHSYNTNEQMIHP
ncbi:unnamed protein product [Peronospora belbahrii]|uniref:WRKY19-like zinc finger domain-containing protein n=1 Tax=Peronospora belbahrii TaxID=622444 RepID=A0AAU9LET0_9STRA|nr:unnamed protein product [Peronospora belbahrii]